MDDLYSEFADMAALERMKERILAIFGEIKAGVKGLNDLGVKIDGANSVKEFGSAQQAYNAYLKDTDRLKKTLLDTEKKLYESERQYATIIANNRVELLKTNKELKAEAEYLQAATGSREKATAAIKKLTIEKNKLNLYNEIEKKQYDELVAKIEKYENFLKKTGTALEKQKINIGNYAGSLAAPFETLQKKLDEIQTNLAKGIGIGGSDQASLERAASAITTITTVLDKSTQAGVTSQKQVKNLSNAYTDLSITIGKAGGTTETAFLGKLGREVGEAKDSVQDLREELALNASDTKGIDNVVGSLNALAGIAQGAAGAYALLGENQEDAAKVTAKLIAVQGIANSIQQVGQELTRKGTIANKAYVYWQGLVATATNTSATATARLNAVLKLSTIGLVVAALGGLVYLISKAGEATGTFAKNQAILSDINTKATESFAAEAIQIKLLVSEYQNVNTSVKRKKEIQDQLQKDYPAYFANLKTEKEFQEGIAEAADKATKALFLQAKIQAAQQILSEKYKEILDKEFDPSKAITFGDKASSSFRDVGTTLKTLLGISDPLEDALDLSKRADKNVAKAKESYKSFEEFIKDFVTKTNEELFKLGGDPKKGGKEDKTDKPAAKKIVDNTAQELLKQKFEQDKLIIESSADASKKILDDERNTYEDRIDALRSFTEKQMALVQLERQFQEDTEKLRIKAVKESLEAQKDETGANKKEINAQIAKEQKASDEILKTISLKGARDLIKVGEDLNKELKRLKDERQDIRDEERKQIEDYEAWTEAQVKALTDKLIDLEEQRQKKLKESKEKAQADLKELEKKLFDEALTTLSFFLTASVDREMAALDTKKRVLDEDTERRINQINMLGLAESDRVKETAKVQKQAAFENEQLERRKRQLAVQRAKFEKAESIASIIVNTAAAVIKMLKSAPYPLNIALAVATGAIGALQLARAIAAPLPQYRKGTDNAKKGLAIVGEEGQELMQRNGKLYLTPGKPTLMEMAGGEKITPAHLTKDIINSINFSRMAAAGGMTILKANGMNERQAETMISEIKELRRETSRSRIAIYNQQGIESTPYYINNLKR